MLTYFVFTYKGSYMKNLTKICVVCLRPFSWRKKWNRCWSEVKYCSVRCRNNRSKVKNNKQL